MNGARLVAALLLVTFAAGEQVQAQATAARRTSADAAPKGGKAWNADRMKGLMIGVHTVGAGGISLSGGAFEDPYTTASGTGAGFTLGYGVTDRITSYFSLDVVKQKPTVDEEIEGSFGLGHLEFGVRAALPVASLRSTLPYVTASLGRRALGARVTVDDGDLGDVAFHGKMLGVGAGFEHFFSPTMSIDGGVSLAFGKFDRLSVEKEEIDLEVNGTRSMRLRLGVNWRP